MDDGPTQDNPDPGSCAVQVVNRQGFLVGGPSDDEHNDVLRPARNGDKFAGDSLQMVLEIDPEALPSPLALESEVLTLPAMQEMGCQMLVAI